MSDFDKEAERERLREKYERDKQKREATEQMSDLLLKGATMTNAHCDTCGDPIFRYDGQEFCPTCEEVVAGAQAADATDGADPEPAQAADAVDATGATTDETAANEATDAISGEEESEEESEETGPTGDGEAGTTNETPDHIEIKSPGGSASGADDETAASERDPDATATQTGTAAGSAAADAGGRDAVGEPVGAPSTGDGAGSVPTGGEGDLATARESLVRTLVAQARRAEECEDPRRARDHLAAAREAAEALSALSY